MSLQGIKLKPLLLNKMGWKFWHILKWTSSFNSLSQHFIHIVMILVLYKWKNQIIFFLIFFFFKLTAYLRFYIMNSTAGNHTEGSLEFVESFIVSPLVVLTIIVVTVWICCCIPATFWHLRRVQVVIWDAPMCWCLGELIYFLA